MYYYVEYIHVRFEQCQEYFRNIYVIDSKDDMKIKSFSRWHILASGLELLTVALAKGAQIHVILQIFA
jgi:hypothetical protein